MSVTASAVAAQRPCLHLDFLRVVQDWRAVRQCEAEALRQGVGLDFGFGIFQLPWLMVDVADLDGTEAAHEECVAFREEAAKIVAWAGRAERAVLCCEAGRRMASADAALGAIRDDAACGDRLRHASP